MKNKKLNKMKPSSIPKPIVQQNYLFDHIHDGIVCLCCGRVMISYHRHDYKTCSCNQETMIDGGQCDYIQYGGKYMDLIRQVQIVPIIFNKNGKRSKRKLKTFREVFSKKNYAK
jgi:hypothetical protein